jgi:hypothetical protein
MNSSAAIKAFCGRNDGVVCTSSNAVPLFDVYLKEYDKMFFFPDQHLGRNTGAKFGIPLDKMALWNPFEELGGNTEEELHAAKLILWRGHCSVHGRFKPWHVEQIRKAAPDKSFGSPGMYARSRRDFRFERLDIFHYQHGDKRAERLEMGNRHGTEFGSAPAKTISRQRHSPARARFMYVRDDVSHRAAESGVGIR